MARLRHAALILVAVFLIGCFIPLTGLMVSNPTGRRFSSEAVLRTGEGDSQEIGGDGERVLGLDLGLPNNNASDQRSCVCNSAAYTSSAPAQCNRCSALSANIPNFRIPDFIAPSFIAEAKNVRELRERSGDGTETRDIQQIRDLAAAAFTMDIPLWVYVRVDSVVDPNYDSIVEATGGSIIYYFANEGYIDPTERLARNGIGVALVILALIGGWEVLSTRPKGGLRRRRRQPAPQPPPDPVTKATRSVEQAADYKRKTQEKTRRIIDEADSNDEWHDL